MNLSGRWGDVVHVNVNCLCGLMLLCYSLELIWWYFGVFFLNANAMVILFEHWIGFSITFWTLPPSLATVRKVNRKPSEISGSSVCVVVFRQLVRVEVTRLHLNELRRIGMFSMRVAASHTLWIQDMESVMSGYLCACRHCSHPAARKDSLMLLHAPLSPRMGALPWLSSKVRLFAPVIITRRPWSLSLCNSSLGFVDHG